MIVENFDACFEFLKKAEYLAQNSLQFQALTFNNIACFYKTYFLLLTSRIGKLRVALKYLDKALAIENQLGSTQNISDIHLNICAVQSQLNKHEDALVNAMNSIILIQDEMLKGVLPRAGESPKQDMRLKDDANEGSGRKGTLEERLTILSIAYHNFAVEQEYLNKYEQALRTYQKAFEFSNAHLGPENYITQNLKKVYENAKDTIEKKLAKIKGEKEVPKRAQSRSAAEAKKGFIIKNTPLAEKRPAQASTVTAGLDSRKKIRPSVPYANQTVNRESSSPPTRTGLGLTSTSKNNLQRPVKPSGGEKIENERMPKPMDRRAMAGDGGSSNNPYAIDTRRSESVNDVNPGGGNRSSSEPHNDSANKQHNRQPPEKKGGPAWDRMLSSKGDDSDRADPDEMGEDVEHSE